LKLDPEEKNDIAAAQPQKTAEMKKMLLSWYKDVDAEFLREKDGNIPWKPEKQLIR